MLPLTKLYNFITCRLLICAQLNIKMVLGQKLFSRIFSTLLQTLRKQETRCASGSTELTDISASNSQQARDGPSALQRVLFVMQWPLESDPNKTLDWPLMLDAQSTMYKLIMV